MSHETEHEIQRRRNRAEQRERVLEAAAALFASKGFGGASMREIAREAGVSLSMINYYFGSKKGLFDELLERQHGRYIETVRAALESEDTIEGKVRAYVRAAVVLARRIGPALRVAFVELPNEAPGVLESKAGRIAEIAALMAAHVIGPLERVSDIHFLGPGLGSMIMSHFMARPMMERVFGELPDDDRFYTRYAEVIADQILYGLVGRPPAERTAVDAPITEFLPLRRGGSRPDEP